MSSLLSLPGALLDQGRYLTESIAGTVVLPFRPLRSTLLPLPAAPAIASSSIHRSDPGGDLALVVGGTAGIGKELVYALAVRGADVVLACRTPSKGEDVKTSLLFRAAKQPGARVNLRITVMQLDTSSAESVEGFVQALEQRMGKERKIRLLMLNAGIANVPYGQSQFDKDGKSIVYTTNLLGHFQLTHLLEPRFTTHTRIISTSSTGGVFATHTASIKPASEPNVREPGFHLPAFVGSPLIPARARAAIEAQSGNAYSMTKGMQILFTRALAEKYERRPLPRSSDAAGTDAGGESGEDEEEEYTTPFLASYHPGLVASDIFTPGGTRGTWAQAGLERGLELMMGLCGLTPEEGAATALYLALEDRRKLEKPRHKGVKGKGSKAVQSLHAVQKKQNGADGEQLESPSDDAKKSGGKGKRQASPAPARTETDNGKFWTRNARYSAPQLKVRPEVVQVWWERWCRDAGIEWEL